jgi:sugar/nucleoside kinase (ribokinase family)
VFYLSIFENMRLLTVGSVAFDSIESSFGKADRVIGGAGTYITWAASFFTRQIDLVSVIGEDWPQSELLRLQERGVDTQGVQIKRGEKSFYWSGKYHSDMNSRDTLITELNVLADFDPILPENYRNADFVMLGNLTPSVQWKVLEQMTHRPKLVVLDTMNFWMDTAMDSLKKVIGMCDVLTINDEEARQLSGKHSLLAASKEILSMGPKYLIIKKGEHGALLMHNSGMFYAPALPLQQVKDPTGAGDTFAGGFIGHIARTGDLSFENLKRAVIYGSVMASFCVEEFSLQRIQELREVEIEARVAEFKSIVSFTI